MPWIILAAVILIPLLIAVIRTMLLKAPAPQNYEAPGSIISSRIRSKVSFSIKFAASRPS